MVRLGEYDLSNKQDGASPVDYSIAKRIVHPEYLSTIILNDIGILKLSRQVAVNGELHLHQNYTEIIWC